MALFQRIPLREKIYFYQMLAMTLDAGMPLLQSLQLVQRKVSHEVFHRVLNQVITQVGKGDSLAVAMEKSPQAFQETETTIVRSGEQTGHLKDTLLSLSSNMEATQEVMGKVKGALVYPITVLVALLVASGFIVTIVVPQLLDVYDTAGGTPPASLQVMANVGTILRDSPLQVALVAGVLLTLFIWYMRSPLGQEHRQSAYIRLPLVSGLYKKTILSRILRTLGMLTESGLGLTKSLKLLGKVASNIHYQQALAHIRREVEKGVKLSEAMNNRSDLFPEDITQLISVGEQTASLDIITKKIAHQLDRDTEYTLKSMTTFLEPLAIIVIGIVVGWFAFVMLGSVFSLTDVV